MKSKEEGLAGTGSNMGQLGEAHRFENFQLAGLHFGTIISATEAIVELVHATGGMGSCGVGQQEQEWSGISVKLKVVDETCRW